MAPASALVFAGKSVVAPIIKEIISKAFRYLDSYFSAETMEEMKNKLLDGMIQIEAVLGVVCPDHVEGEIEALDQWFWKLRDAVEEAENAIDELEYYELEEKAKDHQVSDWGSSFTMAKHKVITSIKHVGVLDKTVKQVTHRATLKRLKKAVEGLDRAVSGATNFLEVVKYHKGATYSTSWQENSTNNDRQTGLTSTVTKFVGREKEEKQILEWLTKKKRVEEDEIMISPVHIPIFSLVGHGGMGKTTLAQTICEHDEVVKDFTIIWVTVSTSFNATSVTRKILESVNRETPLIDSLEPLQQALKDKLKSVNKCFLILDDVWEEKKIDEWEKLFAPLRTMKGGSKILLTTRMSSVAEMAVNVMGVAREGLTLEELPEDDNLELFNHHVFSGVNSQDYGELKVIGEQIARKLKGCPLVTKIVGGHLRGNMTSEFWDRFLCEDYLNDFKGNADDIMKVLRLSYYYLPTELQTCFRYCSIFPQDFKIRKNDLIMTWIGSGLISTRENEAKSLEEIGEYYLFQLTTKSFFDKEIIRFYPYIALEEECYSMHDLLHELAEYVSSGECKRITSPARFGDVKYTVRHLCIENISRQYVDQIRNLGHFKNMRTLIIAKNENWEFVSKHMADAIRSALGNSRSLRLIQVNCRGPFNFPSKARNMKHLRSVFVNTLSPESINVIHKLYHLMVLRVANPVFHHSRIVPKKIRNIGNLDRLRYLSYDYFGQFPVSRLASLQELDAYKVQGIEGNKISAIGNLQYLRKLEVMNLQNVDNSDEARSAKLKEKKYLTSLCLEWSTASDAQNLVLDQLEPHANIKRLLIHGYEGKRPPFWIDNLTVKKLVSLQLVGCINWEQLPSLGELVLLRCLILWRLPNLQQIGPSALVSCSGSMELYLPRNLRYLTVEECQELKELPILPTSLASLVLNHVGLRNLPRIGNLHSENVESQQSCLTQVSVENCPRLVSLKESLLEQKQYMGGIEQFTIRNCMCSESVFLPFEEMSKLRVLQIELGKLSIRLCDDLELPLLGSLQCLMNLYSLELEHCSGLVSLPTTEVCSKNLKSLRELRIRGCDNLISLGGLESLPSLSSLEITDCGKFVEAARSSLTGYAYGGEEEHLVLPQLEHLKVDRPALLFIEPLKSLRCTRRFEITIASETEGLPQRWLLQNCPSLQSLTIDVAESLPLSMRGLSSLVKLTLYSAEKLQSLPDLPSSLRELDVRKCNPDLRKKIKAYGSIERDKISHVTRVQMGNCFFILGMECCGSTAFKLWFTDDDMTSSWANQQKEVYGVKATLHWQNKHCCPTQKKTPWWSPL